VAAVTARILAIAAIIAPWLALTPLASTGASSVALYAITLVAAFHGLGLGIATLAKRGDAGTFLIIQWGVACAIAIGGIAIAAGAYTARVQWFVVFYGAAVHSGALAWRFDTTRERIAHELRWERSRLWLVLAAMIGVMAVLHVVGSAGDVGARPFDDDGNVLAQIKRLLDTGGLADRVGYPRTSQLGGSVALDSLAAIAGDVRFARMLDGLELVLFLGLVCARVRARDATSGLWAAIIVVATAALGLTDPGPAPVWTIAALGLALFSTIADADDRQSTAIPGALIAGVLVALRLEMAPLAVVGFLAAWWAGGGYGRTLFGLAAVGAIGFVPLAIARHQAIGEVASHGSMWSHVPLFAAVLIVASPILLLPFGDDRRHAQRAVAWGTGASIAGVASGLVGERGYAVHFLWAIGVVYVAKLVIELSRRDRGTAFGGASLVMALVAVVLIYDGRETAGRARWSHRYSELVYGIDYLHDIGDTLPIADPYERVLATAPPGSTVAVWVSAPEQLDYRTHRIIDLRVPRIAPLRQHSFEPHDPSKLAQLVTATHADYLLVEGDDKPVLRAQQDLAFRLLCTPSFVVPSCDDDLGRLGRATPGTVRLVALH
jgi:hypothetical protein